MTRFVFVAFVIAVASTFVELGMSYITYLLAATILPSNAVAVLVFNIMIMMKTERKNCILITNPTNLTGR